MDIATIVGQTLAVLVPAMPYIKKAGESVAGEVGKEGFKKAAGLFTTIKQRFQKTGDDKASKALDNFADDPDEYSENFARNLTRYLETHPDALDEIKQTLADGGLQEIIATNESIVEKVKMKLSGSGVQKIHADKSKVSDIEMTSK